MKSLLPLEVIPSGSSLISEGLQTRGYYILGTDDLADIWHDCDVSDRRRALETFAESFGATLAPGWHASAALLMRRKESVGD